VSAIFTNRKWDTGKKTFLGRTLIFVFAINLIVCVALLFRPTTMLIFGLASDGLNPQIINFDFSNYWFAGKVMTAGHAVAVLIHDVYLTAAQAYFGAGYQWHSWSYPPHFMLLVWPLSLLPYKIGLVTFVGATLALFVFSCRRIAGDAMFRNPLFWIMMLPVIYTNFVATQNGFLTSALFLLAFAFRAEGRYLLAGFCLAWLTIKPQLGVLIPIYLLFVRDWRTMISASAFTVALIGLSAMVFGIDVWTTYFNVTVPYMSMVMNTGTGIFIYMMPTVFMSARALGLGPETASIVQIAFALPMLALYVHALRRTDDQLTQVLWIAAFTFLIIPYGFNYDMCAFIALATMVGLSKREPKTGTSYPERQFVQSNVALWSLALLPAVITKIALAGAPVGPLIILGCTMVYLQAHTDRALFGPGRQIVSEKVPGLAD